jgi:hypothetical protein
VSQVLLEITPTLLHWCKSHVIRAVAHWCKSIDRGPIIRSHVKTVNHIMVNMFRHATSNMDFSDVVIHLGIVLYIFNKPFLEAHRTSLIVERKSATDLKDVGTEVQLFLEKMKNQLQSKYESAFNQVIADNSFAATLTEESLASVMIKDVVRAAKTQKLRVSSTYCAKATSDVCKLHHSFCYGVLTSVFDDKKPNKN